jgi:hypothetical protein
VTSYPTEYTVRLVQEPMTLYRACNGRDEASLLTSLRSNYEVSRHPPHPADLYATVLHMAVSMFDRQGTIASMARRRPDRIGTHVARLDLLRGHGVCLADTGGQSHWSVWGIPAQLLAFVVDVEEIS